MMMLLYWSMTLLLVNGHDGGKRSLSFELPAFRRQRAHNGPGFDPSLVQPQSQTIFSEGTLRGAWQCIVLYTPSPYDFSYFLKPFLIP